MGIFIVMKNYEKNVDICIMMSIIVGGWYTIYRYDVEHRRYMMNGLTVRANTSITDAQVINDYLYRQFISYLDASPKTVETYTKNLRPFMTWLQVNGITKPTNEDIKAYRDEIKAQHKPSTVQAYIFIVRRFFDWTESAGLYPNVAGKIKGAKLTREPAKDYLTSGQVKTVISGITGDDEQGRRDKAMISLMVACGLRDVEVSRANIEDMRSYGDNTVIFVQGKGRDEKSEFVILPAAVEANLREYLRIRGKVEGAEPLFASLSNNSKGQRMSTRSISGIAKSAMVKAGYNSSKLTAHSLRHTAVTLALLGGATVQEAQQFARHSNINTTMIYAHNVERLSNKCSSIVADSIF